MKIVAYHFGRLSTEQETFTKDVVISRIKIFPNWWRIEGHKLHWRDLGDFINEIDPEIVVVGQGKFGMMSVLPEVISVLEQRKIELVSFKTAKAVEEFNRLIDDRNVLGAFHLTC